MDEKPFKYWQPQTTLTKNRLFNFIVGQRSIGKTTGCLLYARKKFEHEDFEIVFMRRYKTELKVVQKNILANVKRIAYPNDEYRIKGNTLYLVERENGKVKRERPFIHFIALSVSGSVRGEVLDKVRLIIFDEFLVRNSVTSRYLPNEVEGAFFDVYDTIARPSDPSRHRVPVFFLANAFSLDNPYFQYFKITLSQNKTEWKSKDAYAVLYTDLDFANYAKSTEFGRLTAGSDYSEHATGNSFYMDDYKNVEPKHQKGQIFYNLLSGKKVFTVYLNTQLGTIFVTDKAVRGVMSTYSVSSDDYGANVYILNCFKKMYHGKITRMIFEAGNVYFNSLSTKNEISTLFHRIF